MKPGERIRIITECAHSLGDRSWPEAQLTLDQFGFDTYETRWDVDPEAYFIEQLRVGSDKQLASLHEYLLGDDAAPAAADGRPWTAGLPLRVFLSHIHEHRHFVGELKGFLARCGIEAFVAHDDIEPSQRWREAIKDALRTCDAFVALLHEGFHESQWCDQEVGWSLARGVPVIVVRPEGAPRKDGFLEEHQDLRLTYEGALASEVLRILFRDPATHSKALAAAVEALVSSGSYDRTRDLYSLIEKAETLEEEQLRRLEYAVQTNRQVYEAVYPKDGTGQLVPDLVAALVARHSRLSPEEEAEEPF